MAKEKKGFFQEFKEFITRGNVLDMAVGIIIGGAFTAIVTALTSQILQPIVNWIIAAIMGGDGLKAAVTVLTGVYDEAGEIILAESIYIDWGAFITAIINFFLVALILFIIVKTINSVRERADELKAAREAANAPVVEETPAVEEPAAPPAPTTEELLTQIRDLLAAKNAAECAEEETAEAEETEETEETPAESNDQE